MKARSYPKYKPSGVQWLGDVPEHWEVWKVTHGFQRIGSGTTPKSDDLNFYKGNIPWVTTSELRENIIVDTANKITDIALHEHSALRLYPAGTLLFAMYGATIGRMGILGIPATVNQACAAFCQPKTLDSKFIFYWLLMRRPTLVAISTGGGQPNLSQDDLRQLRIAAPPLPEQQAISAYLDRETERIDTLVGKKKRLVELLKEKRTALISHAVTRGLDPAVKLKPSSVQWLGDVPEHWEVKPVRYLFQNLDNKRVPLSSEERGGLGKIYPYYGASGIIDYVDNYIYDETLILVAEDGANLLSRSTPLAFRAEGKYWVNNHAHILRPNYNVITYWECVLQAFDFTPYVSGSAQPKLTSDNLGSIKLPVPPLPEQQAISAYLDRETGKIDALVAKVEEAIEKLTEYRTALISAAVTGKIDVRGEDK
jgi:restriction endonuclease S subunit